MPHAVDYRLPDLLGVAGATVIFILVGAVLMGGFNAKYIHLLERYRGLTGELRMIHDENQRKQSLERQIANYRKRIGILHIASICIALAVLFFLMTVVVASLSVIYPTWLELRRIGTTGVIGGLLLSALGVALDLVETISSRRVLSEEIADLPNIPPEG